MTTGRTCLADDPVLSAFGSRTVRIAEDLREQISRNRATEQALRDYLHARSADSVLITEASPECVRDARAYARGRCAEHGVDGDRRAALELAVSELVGNAVRHGQPPVRYDITADGDELVLVVTDADPRPPGDGTDCGPDCESGRGLFLIEQTAQSWGWEPAEGGKRVWVRV